MVQVTTPLLKFMAEFVLNKAQRLTFDSSSPNGILLFREVSKLIVAYGSRILSLPNAADIYAYKYKGIWISLTILSRGKYLLVFNVYKVEFIIFIENQFVVSKLVISRSSKGDKQIGQPTTNLKSTITDILNIIVRK